MVLMVVVGGIWFDWFGWCKVFVIVLGFVVVVVLLFLVFVIMWVGVFVGVVILGIGFGIYIVVDFVMII